MKVIERRRRLVTDEVTTEELSNMRRAVKFAFLYPFSGYDSARECITLKGLLIAQLPPGVSAENIEFFAGGAPFEVRRLRLIASLKRGSIHVLRVSLSLPLEIAKELPIHNVVSVCFSDDPEKHRYGIRFSLLLPKYLAKTSRCCNDEGHGLTFFFRQNVGKNTTLTVRNTNVTDTVFSRAKLCAAWICSKFAFWVNPILLFEKNGQHYEESARCVFERLVAGGRRDVRFVLCGDLITSLSVDEKYKKQMLKQHSFAHYLSFFRCRSFLGTEALAHVVELRCQSLLVQRKLKSSKNSYIFLQHGVMYMVSLDSPQRSSFKKRNMKGNSFVVASSEKEAQHFIDYAGFDRSDIIVSGLPKFDKSYMHEDADKILIMPTWRIWEFNAMRCDPESTKYVQMVKRIKAAIPGSLQDKVVVAAHPLFNASTFGSVHDGPEKTYDELLREVKLLITDYSSIAYDAFYRGANVVFYWEELQECMEHYGPPTHLMLNEDNAFGNVCYAADELAECVAGAYTRGQREEHIRRYREIVRFSDNCNTDRLISEAVKCGVIPGI